MAMLEDRAPILRDDLDLLLDVAEERAGAATSTQGINLKFHCPNPDHPDASPSFSLNTRTIRWRCYVCDASGSVIDLLMWLDGLSFQDAVEELAYRAGLPSKWREPMADPRRPAMSRPTLTTPPQTDPTREPSPDQEQEAMDRFLTARSWSQDVTDRFGLHVRLRGRGHRWARFPYVQDGRVVAWQDRAVDTSSTWRWLSSSGELPVPFNHPALADAGRLGTVVLTEGASDAVALAHAAAWLPVLGIPGTSGLKDRWLPWLDGLHVVLVLDNDRAGLEMRGEWSDRLDGIAGYVSHLVVPGCCKDMADWLQKAGRERFTTTVSKALDRIRATA